MASLSEESRAFQELFLMTGSLGSKSRNLPMNFSEFVRFLPSAVMLTRQFFLESKDWRISSSDEETSAQF